MNFSHIEHKESLEEEDLEDISDRKCVRKNKGNEKRQEKIKTPLALECCFLKIAFGLWAKSAVRFVCEDWIHVSNPHFMPERIVTVFA